MAQVKTGADASQHVCVCIGYMIPQNSRCFTGHNAGSSSPNPNPGGKAGCGKEQYDANVLSCGYYKRQGFFWRAVFVSLQGGWVSREKQGLKE